MKFPIATAFSALALSLVWASNMPAQQRAEEGTVVTPADVLPVAEAKKRYLESQKHLDALAKGGGIAEITLHETDLEIAVVKPSRDQLRAAVAEAYDARRQLQQSELAELERRIANIKRALAISDAMKETIIEQRTDELLDEMQTPPAESDAQAAETNHRLLDLDAQIAVEEAEAQLKAAKNAYEYSKKFPKGFVTESDVESKASAVKKATLELERAKVKAGRAAAAPAPSEDGDGSGKRSGTPRYPGVKGYGWGRD